MAITPELVLTARQPADPEPDLTSLVVVHRAIRHDLTRAVAFLDPMAGHDLEPARAQSFCRYSAAVLAAVRAHDQNEDSIIWPMVAATARQAVDLSPLSDDHQAIETVSCHASQMLEAFAADPGAHAGALGALVRSLLEMTEEHIADEEAQLLPAMRRYFPAETYRWCERQIMRKAAPPGLTFTMPWLIRHASDGEIAPILAAADRRARIALRVNSLGYRRLERRAFGAGSAGEQ